MIVLAHNAAALRMSFDLERLMAEPAGGAYADALIMVTETLAETRRQEAEEAEARARR